ncbi:MAG TPA: hypothetical protein VEL28_00155 [Candidatus Binatia bacterium]|nr:hypothetical protein [Candidatus Binatia bacterium]
MKHSTCLSAFFTALAISTCAVSPVWADNLGACCFADDGDCILTWESQCDAFTGDYQGDFTTCSPNPCPQPTTTLAAETTTTLPATTSTTLPEPECGNGAIEGGEICDDGNTAGNDCCTATCTFPSPAGCFHSGGSTLTYVDDPSDDSKDKLAWTWKKGSEVTMADFGDPASTTTYQMCVFHVAPAPTTVEASLVIPPGDYWTGGTSKWKLKTESSPVTSGITSALLKPGVAGKSSVKIKGSGSALPDLDLGSEGTLRVLLLNSVGKCWQSGPMPIVKVKGKKTKAAGDGGAGGA